MGIVKFLKITYEIVLSLKHNSPNNGIDIIRLAYLGSMLLAKKKID